MRRRGFTLLELLIVIILIVLISSVTIALMNTFFRGQGARQGATQCVVAFAQAKQLAADQRVMHFIVFFNTPVGGVMEIHKDANGDKVYQGDYNTATTDADPAIGNRPIELPKFVNFDTNFPQWVGLNPTGYCIFNPGFSDMNAGVFDGNAALAAPTLQGDIILKVQNQPFAMCMDIDRGAGKIRRWFFRKL